MEHGSGWDAGLSAAVLEGIAQPVAVVDVRGCIVAVNQAFLTHIGLGAAECAPRTDLSVLAQRHPERPILARIAAVASAPSGKPVTPIGFPIKRTDLPDGTRVLALPPRAEAAANASDRAERGKAAFLANMSHELRTPLNAVIGFADIIKDQLFGPIGSEKYLEYAEEIRRSGHGLLSIINNIIDISRIESGQFMLRDEETDLGELARGCAKQLADAVAAGELTLSLAAPADPVVMRVDPRALQQVLTNILSNALKFTPPGGTVALAVARTPDGAEISVTDSGIGIATAHLARLGETFFQADDALIRNHEGAGLGLALAKSLISLHGGRLDVSSAPGAGTRVAIELPAARLVEAAA
ncbi:MAG: PAS domain-containing sensor histidine kinase [Alphaproteobacteria bacterium]|nr:PAS domain-containing sensor histidine kinase [Alphaproteobacteria bacterium]